MRAGRNGPLVLLWLFLLSQEWWLVESTDSTDVKKGAAATATLTGTNLRISSADHHQQHQDDPLVSVSNLSSVHSVVRADSQQSQQAEQQEQGITPRYDEHFPRSLQCYTTDLVFESPFRDNDEDEEPGAESIVFYLETREDAVTVTTFEMDIRLHRYDPEGLTAHTDIIIQVFVSDQLYHVNPGNSLNKESVWTRVADTKLRANPDNQRALIPVADFTSFTIPGGSVRRAIWFRLKSGKTWIDYTQRLNAPALERASTNGHLSLLSGHAVTVNSISPNQDLFDTTVLSQLDNSIDGVIFAGTVHYKAAKSCDDDTPPLFVESSVDFTVVSDTILGNEDYGNIQTGMDQLLDLLISDDDETLQAYARDYSLQRARTASSFARTYAGRCPWSKCVSTVTKLFIKHHATLDGNRVKGQVYQHTERIINNIASYYPDNSQIYNVGLKGLTVPFQLVLKGVAGARTSNSLLDNVQKGFVSSYTIGDFLTRHLTQSRTQVYEFVVENQVVLTRRRQLRNGGKSEPRRLQNNDLQLTGNLVAATFATQTASEFKSDIDSVFANYSESEYVLGFEYNLGLPGDIQSGNRRDYFEGLQSVEHVVDVSSFEEPEPFGNETTTDDDDDDDDEEGNMISEDDLPFDIAYIYIAAAIIAALVAICVAFYFFRCLFDCLCCCCNGGKSQLDKDIDKMFQEEQQMQQLAQNEKRQREMERKERRELKELKDQERREKRRKEKEERRERERKERDERRERERRDREERRRERAQKEEAQTRSTVPDTIQLSSQEGSWNDETAEAAMPPQSRRAPPPPAPRPQARRGPPGPQAYRQPERHEEPPRQPVAPQPRAVPRNAVSPRPLYGNDHSGHFDASERSGHFDASERSGHFSGPLHGSSMHGSGRFHDQSSHHFQDHSESYNYGGSSRLVETRPNQHPSYASSRRGRESSAAKPTADQPEYSLAELRAFPVPKIRSILRENDVKYDLADATEKEDLVQILVRSGKIRMKADNDAAAYPTRRRESVAACATLRKHPSYTLSQLRGMNEGQLRMMLEEYHVHYNPMQMNSNEDLIRTLVTSGKIILLAEDGHGATRRPSSGQLRRPSTGRLSTAKPSFKLSELRAMSIGQLRKLLSEHDVHYDIAEVSEKEDLVRVLAQSGAVILLADDGAQLRRASSGHGMPSAPPPGTPSYTLSELRAMPIAQLRNILKTNNVAYNLSEISEKEDLVRILAQSGTIVILPEPAPPAVPTYKLSELRNKSIPELRGMLRDMNVTYDPADVHEKEDLVRVLCQAGVRTGAINLVAEDGRPLRRASTAVAHTPPASYRSQGSGLNNSSHGSMQYDHSQHDSSQHGGSSHGSRRGLFGMGSSRGLGGGSSRGFGLGGGSSRGFGLGSSSRSFGSNNNLGLGGGDESEHGGGDGLYYQPPPPSQQDAEQASSSRRKKSRSKSKDGSSSKRSKRKKLKPKTSS